MVPSLKIKTTLIGDNLRLREFLDVEFPLLFSVSRFRSFSTDYDNKPTFTVLPVSKIMSDNTKTIFAKNFKVHKSPDGVGTKKVFDNKKIVY